MSIPKKYPAEVIEIESPLEGIFTVKLKSLKGRFKYLPGQFLHLALDEYDPTMPWPESRCFSIQTSPTEEFLKITFSVKGTFTQRMAKELVYRKQVTLKLPYGNLFTQTHNHENTVFIAGGTGITAFLSLFTDPVFKAYENPILYAGFRSSSFNIYKDQLKLALDINSGFNPVLVYEDRQGMLNIKSISKNRNPDTSYFISGPPLMIKIFKEFLLANGIYMNNINTYDWE